MIDMAQCVSSEVLALIEREQRLWVRLAAAREGADWQQSLLEVTSGEAPPRWTQQRWQYDEAVFVAVESVGTTVAEWLRSQRATIGDLHVTLPAMPEQLSWQQRASRALHGYEVLLWPHVLYELAWQPLKKGLGSGTLIGPGDVPSFVTFANAAASFLGVPLGPGGGTFDSLNPAFRFQDLSGRIRSVRLGAADVEVHVEGSGLDGAAVELASGRPGPVERLGPEASQIVRFALPDGLPSGAWVVLKRDHLWVDRKFLNWPYTANPDPGVETVVEPQSQLEALVSSGEGPTTEFKIEVPADREGRRTWTRTVAAFANADGGSILFGVRNDDGAVLGLADVTQAKQDAIVNVVRNVVTPLPAFTIERIDLDDRPGRAIIVLTIESGDAPPYGIEPADPRYYIRRGGTTFPASAEQVRALARSHPPAGQSLGFPRLSC